MKIEARRLVDQVLAVDKPCLGAVFCTYTFDPAYFEEHVLRSLLRLSSDPDEDGARFHEEARAALCVTPWHVSLTRVFVALDDGSPTTST